MAAWPRRSSLWFLGVGAVGMVVNFSTLLLVLAAVHEITRSSAGSTDKVVAFVLLYLIVLLPVLVPVVLAQLLGGRADHALDVTHRWVGTELPDHRHRHRGRLRGLPDREGGTGHPVTGTAPLEWGSATERGGPMEWKLELVVVPVADQDRAKAFYVDAMGFDLIVDHRAGDASA